MNEGLFRAAALQQQSERLWGELLLSRPLSSRLVTAFLTGLTLLAIAFLLSNQYARKVTVNGLLSPVGGVIDVTAPSAGVLQSIAVAAGAEITRGMPLFTLVFDQALVAGQPYSDHLNEIWQQQWQSLQTQRELDDRQQTVGEQQYQDRRLQLQARRDELVRIKDQQESMLALRQRQLERGEVLWGRGLLAGADVEALRLQLLQQQQAVGQNRLQLADSDAGLSELDREQAARRLQAERERERWRVDSAQLQQQKVRQLAEHSVTVTAPLSGAVSNMLVQSGMNVQAGQPVVSVVPAGASLQVELWLPSSAIGFVSPGQDVSVRVEAFPYQKFGVQHARVKRVSGSAERVPDGRWLYRVLAELHKQSVTAYGQEQPLRPGMAVSADVTLERRSLFEWLLEPLYSVRGHL